MSAARRAHSQTGAQIFLSMEPTNLLYLEHMDQLKAEAIVLDVSEENGKKVIILDQTIFYPQGGGQPYDTGIISSDKSKFIIEQVRYFEGVVKHMGTFENGSFQKGDKVTLEVNKERRLLNSRLHSAGHLVDMAVNEAKPDWVPGKGYHFPDGPYVEYSGTLNDPEKEQLVEDLERIMSQKILENIPVSIKFVEKSELSTYCRHVPENIPEGKPTRIVLFGNFGVPCGGTHVENLSEIKSAMIRKIKGTGTIKVSYDIER